MSPSEVPNFENLLDFTKWYLSSGMPILPPSNPEVFTSDDATASCLFRHGRYQFEMYLIHPNPTIPLHEHPGVENIEIEHMKWNDLSDEMLLSRLQKSNMPHGGDVKLRAKSNGFMLFSAQRWDEGIEMSTIGARWKGNTAGPKHDAIIKRFNPDCYMGINYADVTRKKVVAEDIL